MSMPLGVFYKEELREYDFGPGHPFRGDRYDVFPGFLKEKVPANSTYQFLQADQVTDEDLSLICNEDYVRFTREYYRAANRGERQNGFFGKYHSPDNRPIGRPGKLEEAARLIVGQAKVAADLIQSGSKFNKVVSIGGGMHHAKPNYGEGFCIYNDVAYAAKYLIHQYNLKRVLVLDTDAHAGNGTLEYFYSDPRVMFIDLHQDPRTLYPGTGFVNQIGEGEGTGYTINVPLPVFAGYSSYRLVFDEIVRPLNDAFKPEVIIRNGGSDPHFADELTYLGLSLSGFRMIGTQVRTMSAKTCDGKVIDLIGSGYNKKVLPYGWLALISGLANLPVSIDEPIPIPENLKVDVTLEKTREVTTRVQRVLRDHWRCFR